MSPDRAADLARMVAVAMARCSSPSDLFAALLAQRATSNELLELKAILPALAGDGRLERVRLHIAAFETQGAMPQLAISMEHVASLVQSARASAALREGRATPPQSDPQGRRFGRLAVLAS